MCLGDFNIKIGFHIESKRPGLGVSIDAMLKSPKKSGMGPKCKRSHTKDSKRGEELATDRGRSMLANKRLMTKSFPHK